LPAVDLPCVVLAGGLGSRMLPQTEQLPKMLLSVAGEPFAAHQLRWLAAQGVRRVVLAIGHLGGMIEDYVSDGSAFALDVAYSRDGDRHLGTGGALRNAVTEHDLHGPVLTLYGDSYVTLDVREVVRSYERVGLPALMVVYRNDDRLEPSNASFDGRLVRYDKRRLASEVTYDCIDDGLSIIHAEMIRRLPADSPVDLADEQSAWSREGQLAGHEAQDRYYEIGSPNGLAELDRHLRSSG